MFRFRRENYEKYRQIKNKGRHIVSHQPTVHQLLNESGGSDFGLPKLVRSISGSLPQQLIVEYYLHWTTTFEIYFSGSSDTNHDSLL